MSLFPFIFLIALSRTFSIMLKRNDERGPPSLVPDLNKKAWCFSPLSMVLAIGFCRCFYQVEKVLLYLEFTESFYQELTLDFIK